MILLYSNGLTEELLPKNKTFSDQEILTLFVEFDKIETQRLDEVPNTWCVWGEFNNPQSDDYNKLGSDVIQRHCYSHIIFLHDTEVDPSWNLSESIIQHGYLDFKKSLLKFLDKVAIDTLQEIEQSRIEQGQPNLMNLKQVGISIDKRIIFNFDPNKQPPEFYDRIHFVEFAEKCYKFLQKNYKDEDDFVIFADKKMIFVMKDENVKIFTDHLIKIFEEKEDYLTCGEIKKIYEKWKTFKEKPKKKRGRPLKNKND